MPDEQANTTDTSNATVAAAAPATANGSPVTPGQADPNGLPPTIALTPEQLKQWQQEKAEMLGAPLPASAIVPTTASAPATKATTRLTHSILHDAIARFHRLIADLHTLETKEHYEVKHIEEVIKKYF